ncbi:phosphate/phosphite/phosphonate ABC transporter substrate-binding protein [Roseomonas sp. 18066]|uniref:phosphate/phosphite/phosphonate ABC transporter substrate-binding protein n=1 Tax=Roseomonas sp. 18066 TaxID=2681412 RepID=UPI0013586379|nr:phosphate/phosphite/phosphonate ABC transporter substrate-binding protein [Roseomonas sp. 18066]
MITRRTLAGLVAGSALLPAALRAQAPAAAQAVAMPAAGERPWAKDVPQIRIGLLGGENESDRLGRFDAYRKLIEDTFKVPTRLYPAADYAGVMQAFSARQIEASSMGASGYAGTWLDTNGAVQPLVVPREADGGISYISVLVTRKDSGITSLEQMRGKSLAWADPNSTSGYLVPRSELRGANIDINSYFSRTGFAGGHEQAVVAVLQKQYDGCCTWASGQGEMSEGFTRGNLRAMVEKKMLNMSDVNIIWKSRPILNGPLVVRKELPEAFKRDFTNFHLALPSSHPDIYAQVERGGGLGYAEVTHEQFEPIVQLRREEAAERRRRS